MLGGSYIFNSKTFIAELATKATLDENSCKVNININQ